MQKHILTIQTSKKLMLVLISLHLLACLSIVLASFYWQVKILLLISILLSLIYQLCQRVWRICPRSVIAIETLGNQDWLLSFANGDSHVAKLQGDSVCTTHIVILNFRLKRCNCVSITLLTDSLPSTIFHNLRVSLLSKQYLNNSK